MIAVMPIISQVSLSKDLLVNIVLWVSGLGVRFMFNRGRVLCGSESCSIFYTLM